MVQLRLVADDRRERAREARKHAFLAAASAVIDREGLEGLTMAAVAEQLDCAVGTIYSYFPSKAALVVGLQGAGVDTLVASHARAVEQWDEVLDEDPPATAMRRLVHLVGFGGFVAAASVVFADEFDLQRRLLSQVPPSDEDSIAQTRDVIDRWLGVPRELLGAAVAEGAIAEGDDSDRAVRWIAALNGLLLVDNVATIDRYRFRAPHHARGLTAELLRAWGAGPEDLAVAASQVERFAAVAPLAPPLKLD